jgi:hypothetical protein
MEANIMAERINKYLEEVTKYIYDEDKANKVKDELLDHIYNLQEEHIERGLSNEESIDRALLNMGSAKEVGRKLNSSYISKKSKIRLCIIVINLIICFMSIDLNFYNADNFFLKLGLLIEVICIIIYSGIFFYGMYNKIFNKFNVNVLYQIRSVNKPSTFQAIGKKFILFYIILIGGMTVISIIEGEFSSNFTLEFFLMQLLIIKESYDTGATICEEGLIIGYRFIKWKEINSNMWMYSYRGDKSMSELKLDLNNKNGKPTLRQTIVKVRNQQKDDVSKIISQYLN